MVKTIADLRKFRDNFAGTAAKLTDPGMRECAKIRLETIDMVIKFMEG